MGGYRFADAVDIPTGIGPSAQRIPECIELCPLHEAGKRAAKGGVKGGFFSLRSRLTTGQVKQVAHGDHRLSRYAYYATAAGSAANFRE